MAAMRAQFGGPQGVADVVAAGGEAFALDTARLHRLSATPTAAALWLLRTLDAQERVHNWEGLPEIALDALQHFGHAIDVLWPSTRWTCFSPRRC